MRAQGAPGMGGRRVGEPRLVGVLPGEPFLWLQFGAGKGKEPCPGHGVMEQGRPWRGRNTGGLALAVGQSIT